MVGVVDVDAFGGEVGVAELGEGVADGLVGAFGLSGGAEGRGEVLGGFGAELLSSWGGEVCGGVAMLRSMRTQFFRYCTPPTLPSWMQISSGCLPRAFTSSYSRAQLSVSRSAEISRNTTRSGSTGFRAAQA